MKREFEEYLKAINIPNAIIGRIESLFPYIQCVCPEESTTLFVKEYLQEDGTRVYESVIFFSENFVCEAKQFVTEINVDVTPIKNQIHYMELKIQDYELRNPNDKSRFYLEAYFRPGSIVHLVLRASKENCDYALQVLSNILKPNLNT